MEICPSGGMHCQCLERQLPAAKPWKIRAGSVGRLEVGDAMLFGSDSDPRLAIARGRAMAALSGCEHLPDRVSLVMAAVWSSRRVCLARLSAFCPALLAHGGLMTSDACLTLFLLLSVWAIWELLHEITPLRLLGGMLAIGGLFFPRCRRR